MKLKVRPLLLLIWIFALVACFYRPAAALLKSAQGGKSLFHILESTTLSKERFPCLRYTPLTGKGQAGYQASVENLGASISLNSAYSPTYLMLANAYCLSLDKETAAPFYQDYARLNPRDPWGTLNLMAVNNSLDNADLSQETLKKSRITGAELAILYKDLAANRPDINPLPHIEKAVELFPSDKALWNLWLLSGNGYEQNQRWDMAMETYQGAVRAQERLNVHIYRGKFYYMIGRLYQNRPEFKDLHTALEYYQKALQNKAGMTPSDISGVHTNIAGAYRALRPEYTVEQALQEYQLALQASPNSYWALIGIGSLYMNDVKDPDTAKSFFQAAIALVPKNPDAYLYLGDLYKKEGSIEQAKAAYQEALLRRPDWEPAKQRLASIAEGQGK